MWTHPESHETEMARRYGLLQAVIGGGGTSTSAMRTAALREFRTYCRLVGERSRALSYMQLDKAWRCMEGEECARPMQASGSSLYASLPLAASRRHRLSMDRAETSLLPTCACVCTLSDGRSIACDTMLQTRGSPSGTWSSAAGWAPLPKGRSCSSRLAACAPHPGQRPRPATPASHRTLRGGEWTGVELAALQGLHPITFSL